MIFEIFTDGSFCDETKQGFWSFIIILNEIELARHFGTIKCANVNPAERAAVLKAFEWLQDYPNFNKNSQTIVYTDSTGLIGKIDKYRLKNAISDDQWKPFEYFVHSVRFEWIRGHSGNVRHNICDKICRNMLKAHRRGAKYNYKHYYIKEWKKLNPLFVTAT